MAATIHVLRPELQWAMRFRCVLCGRKPRDAADVRHWMIELNALYNPVEATCPECETSRCNQTHGS